MNPKAEEDLKKYHAKRELAWAAIYTILFEHEVPPNASLVILGQLIVDIADEYLEEPIQAVESLCKIMQDKIKRKCDTPTHH